MLKHGSLKFIGAKKTKIIVFNKAGKIINVKLRINDIHSPREIIRMVCDFPYKIIEKCFQ